MSESRLHAMLALLFALTGALGALICALALKQERHREAIEAIKAGLVQDSAGHWVKLEAQ